MFAELVVWLGWLLGWSVCRFIGWLVGCLVVLFLVAVVVAVCPFLCACLAACMRASNTYISFLGFADVRVAFVSVWPFVLFVLHRATDVLFYGQDTLPSEHGLFETMEGVVVCAVSHLQAVRQVVLQDCANLFQQLQPS